MSLSAGSVSIGVSPDTKGFGSMLHSGIMGESSGLGALGMALGGLVKAGVATAVAGIAAVVTTGMKEAIQAQNLNAQFAAGIKATGNAAGLSVGHMDELAASVAGYSGQSYESIGKTEQLLQTFVNIKDVGPNKIFDQATEAAANMAAKMGGDASGEAIKLGRALNDPVKGVTSLTRVGVQFTQAQKDSIAAMVKSGDTMGAQKVILAELNKEFGGAAAAAGQTLTGSLNRVHVAFGEISKGVMEGILPIVTPAISGIASAMTAAMPHITSFMSGIQSAFNKDGMSGVITSLGNSISAALPVIGAKLKLWGTAFVSWVQVAVPPMLVELGKLLTKLGTWVLTTALPWIGTQLVKWGKAFTEWIAPQIAPMLTQAGLLLGALGTWILDTGLPWIGSHLGQWATAFVNWVGPLIGPLMDQLGVLLVKLGEWLWNDALPALGTHLQKWADAFCAWVGPMIPPFLVELGKLLVQLGTWARTVALPEIVSKLGEWGLAFAKWVGPAAVDLIGKLGDLWVTMSKWMITTALPAIAANLVKWGTSFAEWVPGAALGLIVKLGELWVKMSEWMITTALPAIVIKLATWSGEFVRWVADVIRDLPGKLADLLVKIVEWAATVPGKILSGLGDLTKLLLQGGKDVVTGLLNGIKSAPDAIKTAIQGVGTLIVNAVKAFFGINSPSTVMAGFGGHIISGLIQGIVKNKDQVPKLIQSVFGDIKNGVGGIIGWLGSQGGNLLGDVLGGVGNLGSALGGLFSGSGTGVSGGGSAGGASQWMPQVLEVLNMLGQSPMLAAGVLRRINFESGGDPNIVNTTDWNAAAGHPSISLMQTIPSTFAAYAGPFAKLGITNPLANIYAGVAYEISRYGSVAAVDPLVRPSGYALGTNNALPGAAYVGEHGKELMYFNGGETIVPNNRLGGGLSSADLIALGDRIIAALQAMPKTYQMGQRQMVGGR